jgi:hypothetical protein
MLSAATRDKLKTVSTATVCTALFKARLLQSVHPGRPAAQSGNGTDGRGSKGHEEQ